MWLCQILSRPIQNSPRPTRPASALLVCAVLPPEPRQFCTSTYYSHMGMGQYLLIPFLVGWTSIYQLFWCSPGIPGFWSIPIYTYKVTQVHTYSRSTKCMHVWLLCNLCNVAFIIIHTCNVVKYCFNAQPESSNKCNPIYRYDMYLLFQAEDMMFCAQNGSKTQTCT